MTINLQNMHRRKQYYKEYKERKKRMNILVFTHYFFPEQFRVNTLCKALSKMGHKVTVLTGYPQYPQGKIYDGFGFGIPYEKEWNGVAIERIKVFPRGKTPLGLLNNCMSFVLEGKRWVRNCTTRFDVVFVFGVSPVTVGLPAVAYKKKFNTPLFFNAQDLWPDNVEAILGIHNKAILWVLNRVVDKIYLNSDKILCSSRSFVKRIAHRGINSDKLVYWPQFCEKPVFSQTEKPHEYNSEFFNIVFAGNLGEAQGLELLTDAATLLKDEKIRFYLVGDGRAKKKLIKIVKEKGLSDTIFFLGRKSEQEANLYVHYADCSYLSFKDRMIFDMTIPAKLQTYLACGSPILAAVSGESADIITTAQCGIISEINPRSVADSVHEMISLKEQGSAEIMRKNAEEFFNKEFEGNKLVNNLVCMFKDFL